MILITHDMGVVAENADRVVVMYAGRKVEEAPVDDLFERRRTPIRAACSPRSRISMPLREANRRGPRLNEIKGMVPVLSRLPDGCAFAPRCGFATDQCRAALPPLLTAYKTAGFTAA